MADGIERALGHLQGQQEATAKSVERIEAALAGINDTLARLAQQGETLVSHAARISDLEDAERKRRERELVASGWIGSARALWRYAVVPISMAIGANWHTILTEIRHLFRAN